MTSGGWHGTNRTQRRILATSAAGFLGVVSLILIANAESTISDLAMAGRSVPQHLVWCWEWSSALGWLSVYPLLWRLVSKLRPPRFGWLVAAPLLGLGSVVASGWHIAVMVVVRHAYYAATGEGPYRFFGMIGDRLLYEYRKDVATYLQFMALAALVQWLVARAGASDMPAQATSAPTLPVVDGAARHSIPLDEIETLRAAGNYVEVEWRGRTLLHRATLTATSEVVGHAFVRIHRGLLVRRDAIVTMESAKTGDFTISMRSGIVHKGSRRYRDGVLPARSAVEVR